MDGVLVITANPGYAGQRLADSTPTKVWQVCQAAQAHGRGDVLIEVDGNVNDPNAAKMRTMGANLFAHPFSACFMDRLVLNPSKSDHREQKRTMHLATAGVKEFARGITD